MNFANLPLEVLHEIFQKLSGNEILLCRKVCNRWTRAVDSLSDHLWRKLCEREYPDIYEEAFFKATLSWTQLYKSLSLWSNVSDADVTIKEIPNGWTDNFKLLKDGVLSYPQNYKKWDKEHPSSFDTIVYYKLATLEEFQRECFNFYFSSYMESNKILLFEFPRYLDGTSERAKVLLKENKDLYYLSPKSIDVQLFLVHDRIYCCNYKQIMVAEMVEKNGNYTLETKHVPDAVSSDVVTITKINKADRQWRNFATEKTVNDRVHILTEDGTVYSLVGTMLEEIYWEDHPNEEILHFDMLKLCSYERSNPMAFNYFINDTGAIIQSDINSVYYYGKVLIMSSTRSTSVLQIFHGETNNGKTSINKGPDKVIDLSKHKDSVSTLPWNDLEQIDVFEVENGHNIIVLYCSKILVIELISHDD